MIVELDPVIFSLGPLQVRWYGMMYVIGFVISGFLMRKLVDEGFFHVEKEKVDSYITHSIIGLFLGARFFYVFVYNWDYYSQNLPELLAVWRGGLSYHGAIIGLIGGAFVFARKNKIPFLQILDVTCVVGSQGVFWGRIGNFINGELYGRVTEVPWGMIFPGGGPYPRHPSQLYEAVLEGLFLFCVLWMIRKRVRVYGVLTSIYFIGYASLRFIAEYFREPDSQLGYYFGGTTTMGQILCLLMGLGGILALMYSLRKNTLIEILPPKNTD
ncbi:prolipoprotein diacylglyceryl transferase [Bacteriovoracales bacterium]|nr:prolipoprotein diacylglyceryl transferase [Bacteriovoracales bacterium]